MTAEIISMSTRTPIEPEDSKVLLEKLVVSNLYESARLVLNVHGCKIPCRECLLLEKAAEMVAKHYTVRNPNV